MNSRRTVFFLTVCSVMLVAGATQAADGTWLGTTGNWSDSGTWSGGTIATGLDATAYFTGVNITAAQTITVDTPTWTVGNVTFTDDTTSSHNLTLAGGTNALTLDVSSGSPAIDVTQNNRTLTVSCSLSGDDGLTKAGTGVLTLTGTNTYSGGTTLSAGTLTVGNNLALGSGNVTVTADSTITPAYRSAGYRVSNGLSVNAGVTLTGPGSTQYYSLGFDGVASGSGSIEFGGGNNGNSGYKLGLFNAANTFTGTIKSKGGTSALVVNSMADGPNPIRLNRGPFVLNSGTASPIVFNSRTIELIGTTYGGDIRNNNGTSGNTITINTDLAIVGTGNKTFTLSGSNSGDNTFAGAVTNGSGSTISLTKDGSSKWILTGANTYTGNTTLNAGTLSFRGTPAMPTSTKFISKRNTLLSARTDDAGPVTLGSEFEISSIDTSSGIISQHSIDIRNNGGATTGTRIVLDKVDFASGDMRPGRQVNATGDNGFILQIGDVETNPDIRGTATGGPNRFNPTTAAISITGVVQPRDGGSGVYPNGNTIYLGGTMTGNDISGTIADPADYTSGSNANAAPTDVYKGDTGEWTLSGTNSYTGSTTIYDGTLIVSGTLAGTTVTVTNSGTLKGTGTLGGDVDMIGSGTISLIDGSIGTMTIVSNLNIDGSAGANEIYFDLGNAAGGTDKIVVTGNVTMATSGAGVIVLSQLPGTRIDAGTYDLIDASGTMVAASNFDLATTVSHGNTYTLQVTGTKLQVVVAAAAAGPDPVYWKGSTDTNWTTAGNWYDDEAGTTPASGVPGYNSDVHFYAAGATRLTTGALDSDFDINSLTYTTGAIANTTILGAKTLILETGNGITVNTPDSGTPVHTIAMDVEMATNQTWTVHTNADLRVSGVIGDFGAGNSFTKAGVGNLRLSGLNTYMGATIVTQGTLQVWHLSLADASEADPMGMSSSDPSNLVLNPGTTLEFVTSSDADRYTDRGFTINGTSPGDSATLYMGGSGNKGVGMTYGGSPAYGTPDQTRTLILDGTLAPGGGNYNRGSACQLSAKVADNGSGAVSLVKNGSGYWRIAGNCTYSGGTTINEGYLRVAKDDAFPTAGAVTLADTAGAKLVFDNYDQTIGSLAGGGSTGGNVELGSGAFTFGGSSSTSHGGVISGTGDVTKQGTGTQTFTGANTYSGVSTINAGTLEVGGAGTLMSGDYTNIIVNSGVFRYSSSAAQELSGIMSGAGSVVVDGSGTLTLSAANTYSGATIISNGVLKLASSGSIDSSTDITIAGGGTLDVTNHTTYVMPGANTYVLLEGIPTSEAMIDAGDLDISSAVVTISGTPSDAIIIATYTNLTGSAFAETNGVPAGWSVSYAFNGNQILLAPPLATPVVTNTGSEALTETSCSLQGSLVAGSRAYAWICWGTHDAGTSSTSMWDNVESIGQVGQGTPFSVVASGLVTNHTYWFRCYATNAVGIGWSDSGTAFNGTPVEGGGGGGGMIAYADMTISSSSDYPNRDDDDAFNGVGLTGDNHNNTANDMWLVDTGDGVANSWLKIGLGNTYRLDYLRVWNYNETANATTKLRGINQCDIYVAGSDPGNNVNGSKADFDGTGWTLLNENQIFANADQLASVTNSDPRIDLGRTSAAYLAIRIDSNHGGDSYVGLSEMQIYWAPPASIANLAPTNISDVAAVLNASLAADPNTNYAVYVHFGSSDGGTNFGWDGDYDYIETRTNSSGTSETYSVSFLKEGLKPNTTNYYTFRASNDAGNVWAKPSWMFVSGAPTGTGSVFMFK